MTTRWKLMAGVLGFGMAGLAGVAGQGPKSGDALPPLPELPKAADAKPSPPPVDVPPPAPASLPPLPDVAEVKLPPAPPKADAPKPEPAKKPEPTPTPAPLPSLPPAVVIPASGTLPPAPSAPAALPPAPALPAALPTDAPKPAAPLAAPALPVTFDAPVTAAPPAPVEFTKPVAVTPMPATPPVTQVAAVVPAAVTKFRIVLRVGEGEPVFEVRHGDDLVMKVVSDKVDVKSPEKGGGLSAVTATGKVRFVGFGSEGTCDSLSFLAGTGEVALSGTVKVQVKDKIGRVESELSADQMRYKIDTTTLPGSIKP